ncbi:(p)ppGpp synthetase [Arthrobacter yangruifuii]|uniref:(P)ppGpp synthetase n=1 Tax=Arthrobacter yangruifuii TaxID=2606616 RepID=A0A5N6MF27_9MICC|nr:RelA/SpoT domain-containing protein [Arthrobacter yangruifuii]KAD3515072.1 (p)ppGpp synthetase [Arthrobacter yangruifuii]
MAWTEPHYSKGEIKRAGFVLIDPTATSTQRRDAIAVVNNWRSAHGFPLNTLQISLRKKATDVDANALVAQRIKRLPSIIGKLERYPSMNVSRMQDLGGCRAVLADIDAVNAVVDKFLVSRHKHRLIRQDDYLSTPKSSGYRGVHLVYAYNSDRGETWNNLSVEVQVRTQLQHAWATAVETVGLFTNQALKSSMGEDKWLRFFQVMSSAIALRENQPVVGGTSTSAQVLKAELQTLATELDVIGRLQGYANLLQETEQHVAGAKFVLLTLDIPNSKVTITGYTKQNDAAAAYDEEEARSDSSIDVVLVSVGSIAGLRSAYPNYFLDTTRFVSVLQETLE